MGNSNTKYSTTPPTSADIHKTKNNTKYDLMPKNNKKIVEYEVFRQKRKSGAASADKRRPNYFVSSEKKFFDNSCFEKYLNKEIAFLEQKQKFKKKKALPLPILTPSPSHHKPQKNHQLILHMPQSQLIKSSKQKFSQTHNPKLQNTKRNKKLLKPNKNQNSPNFLKLFHSFLSPNSQNFKKSLRNKDQDLLVVVPDPVYRSQYLKNTPINPNNINNNNKNEDIRHKCVQKSILYPNPSDESNSSYFEEDRNSSPSLQYKESSTSAINLIVQNNLEQNKKNCTSVLTELPYNDCAILILQFLTFSELSKIGRVSKHFLKISRIAMLKSKSLKMSNLPENYHICTRQLFTLVHKQAIELERVCLRIGCQTPTVLTTTNLPYLKRLVKRNKNIWEMNVDKSFIDLSRYTPSKSLCSLAIRMTPDDTFCDKLPCLAKFKNLESLYIDLYDANQNVADKFVECLHGCQSLRTLCFGKINSELKQALSKNPLHNIKNAFCQQEMFTSSYIHLFPSLTSAVVSISQIKNFAFFFKNILPVTVRKLFVCVESMEFTDQDLDLLHRFYLEIQFQLRSPSNQHKLEHVEILPAECQDLSNSLNCHRRTRRRHNTGSGYTRCFNECCFEHYFWEEFLEKTKHSFKDSLALGNFGPSNFSVRRRKLCRTTSLLTASIDENQEASFGNAFSYDVFKILAPLSTPTLSHENF